MIYIVNDCYNSTVTIKLQTNVASEAGTPYISEASELNPVFSGICAAQFLVFYVVFYR
jgi:hypothetical protein